ncbi:hypothetical protein Lal_00010823 [Lupinus albus]|uniref:Uncharacterized protein n=1 Tax=Lupinus albus TaxID=3870 RepID=A0A6A4PTW6_LUPAL|nr:hypothetical protein Lalb_Chr11g0074701 [Lupinus albus]KAF1892358.1 hypothetical protein Lal_00010823 [Lupinus albus]
MEAHKERKEELEKGKETKKGSKNVANEEYSKGSKSKLDEQVTKRIIGEFIIPSNGNNENEKAQVPNDVLAFSRSVNKIDSLLE